MRTWRLNPAAVTRLHRQAKAERWRLSLDAFADALERSARRAFTSDPPDQAALERYAVSLHLEDLALACACAAGIDEAWDHFILEYRPALYRAADAIDPGGGARELADSLYGELFGLQSRDGVRQSHFHYFHGRSSLSTWLRAVISQRYVDRLRSVRRFDPLPVDEGPHAIAAPSQPINPKFAHYIVVMRTAFAAVVAELAARDRLRLNCYYAQQLTLAQIAQALGEHEATVSRNLARTRRSILNGVERILRTNGMTADEIAECFAIVSEDTGPLDVTELLGSTPRKEMVEDRSN